MRAYLNNFQFSSCKRILNELGGISKCAELCMELNITKPLIVSDRGIEKNGILDLLIDNLDEHSFNYLTFKDVIPDPPESLILEIRALAESEQIDGVIGLGGGSSMDCAKLIAVLSGNELSLESIYGIDNIPCSRLPLILIPTTAGTGSEVTPISIITTGETTKAGIVSQVLLPDIAILDAQLTVNLPSHVTAATGIDAMVHAIEAFTSKHKKNPYSDMLAKEALKLLSANIESVVTEPQNIEARQNMLFGACLAGQAFANAPVAAVHALAYPLGGHFHISHGLSNALVLPYVLEFNGSEADSAYGELIPYFSCMNIPDNQNTLSVRSKDGASAHAQALANYFLRLSKTLGLPTKLRELGIEESDLETLASDAMLQTRLLVNNPKELSYQDALKIYKKAF